MTISAADLSAATKLTRAGRLLDATRVIQAALGFGAHSPASPQPYQRSPATPERDEAVIDVAFREYPAPAIEEPAITQPPARLPSESPSESPAVPRQVSSSSFTSAQFSFGANSYRYRLYVPGDATRSALLPVVVMLHGCKQDSDDFARGTGMNALAEREQVIVIYPEQLRKVNSMGCWNWFEPGHQQRGTGEPAMIAALARQVAAEHGGDPARIYVAGLSAGAAMAALLGKLYPEVFAAVGAHSGLPPGAASDVASAFAAMRQGAGPGGEYRAIPTIVFHGSSDKTVVPRNADAITSGQLAAWSAAGTPLTQAAQDKLAAGRATTRTIWTDAAGQARLEVWRIAGGPHAWSGGDGAGSFTDPRGPSASEAMLRFFLVQRRGA